MGSVLPTIFHREHGELHEKLVLDPDLPIPFGCCALIS